MTVFRVMLTGYNLILKTEDGLLPCGFVINEYVLAKSENDAIQKATEKVRKRIANKEGVMDDPAHKLDIKLDEVESGMSLWKLRNSEGFTFFPIDK